MGEGSVVRGKREGAKVEGEGAREGKSGAVGVKGGAVQEHAWALGNGGSDAALSPQHGLDLNLSAVVPPPPLLQDKPTHRRWSRSRVPGPGAQRQSHEEPVRKATQSHPQQRHVLRRSVISRDARRHRSCQLSSEAPSEHSSSAAHLRPSQCHCRWRRQMISGLPSALAPKSCTTWPASSSATRWKWKRSPTISLCRMQPHAKKKQSRPTIASHRHRSQCETVTTHSHLALPRHLQLQEAITMNDHRLACTCAETKQILLERSPRKRGTKR